MRPTILPTGKGKPPWWPENEPWPPRAGGGTVRARVRFFRRFAVLAAAVLLLGVYGALSLAWLAATSLGVVAPLGQRTVAMLFVGAIGPSV